MSDVWRNPEPMVATELTAEQRRHAVHIVAQNALGAADLVELLDMLGLFPEEGRAPSPAGPVPEQPSEPLRRIREFAEELIELRKAEAAKHVRRRRQPATS